MDKALGGIRLRAAVVDEVMVLRHNVLTAGTQRTTSDYPGDRDSETRHYGAFDGNHNLACCTFLKSEWQGEPAWQLRGMAVDPEYRRQGLGAALLAYAEEELRKGSPIRRLWCNARLKAVDFYLRHGWEPASDEFEIPGVGPHKKLAKSL